MTTPNIANNCLDSKYSAILIRIMLLSTSNMKVPLSNTRCQFHQYLVCSSSIILVEYEAHNGLAVGQQAFLCFDLH